MRRRAAQQLVPALALALVSAACATPTPYEGGDIYLAHYRPLVAPPGTVVVSLTASLIGTLAIQSGCVVVFSPEGTPTMPAFRDQVRLVTRNGRIGIHDTEWRQTAYVGDVIGVGGAPPPEASDFAATRLTAPPPSACPDRIFTSNAGFGKE